MPNKFDLTGYLDRQGNLIWHTWPGCHPMFYLTRSNDVLCPVCANAEKQNIVAADANWEDPALHCDECSKRIESAYAESEVEHA